MCVCMYVCIYCCSFVGRLAAHGVQQESWADASPLGCAALARSADGIMPVQTTAQHRQLLKAAYQLGCQAVQHCSKAAHCYRASFKLCRTCIQGCVAMGALVNYSYSCASTAPDPGRIPGQDPWVDPHARVVKQAVWIAHVPRPSPAYRY